MSGKSVAVMITKSVVVSDVARAIVTDETPRKIISSITICPGRANIKKTRGCRKPEIKAVVTPHCPKVYIQEAQPESKSSH
jgi:hypothetical protein